VAVGYDTNERHDDDLWPAGRTTAVLPRLVAADSTPLLQSKLFGGFVTRSCSLRQCVLCSASFLSCGATSRHGMARLVTARLRLVDAARVWVLAATRMNGTMATNGLRRTNAVLPRLVAADSTPLLHSKSCVCRVFVFFLLAASMCVGADARNDTAR